MTVMVDNDYWPSHREDSRYAYELPVVRPGARPEPALDPDLRAKLTPAEQRVCLLVLQGMSYKEMARELDRSFSTIDHHLRHIRAKLQVRSTSRLMGELARRAVGVPSPDALR